MKQIFLVVSLACTMALVESDCTFADPCLSDPSSRVICGSPGISKFPCLWLGCCFDDSSSSCFEKVSICTVRNVGVALLCPGSNTKLLQLESCELTAGETCGIGTMVEQWRCHSGFFTFPLIARRCCCVTPCSGVNRCDIPPADRAACVEGSGNINTQADCFAAHCCFEDGAPIPCFEPNIPPEITCDMVYPGCEAP